MLYLPYFTINHILIVGVIAGKSIYTHQRSYHRSICDRWWNTIFYILKPFKRSFRVCIHAREGKMMKTKRKINVLFGAPRGLIAKLDKLATKRRMTRSKLIRTAIRQFLLNPEVQEEITPKPLRRTARVIEVEQWFLSTMQEYGNQMRSAEMCREAIKAGIGWGSLTPVRATLRKQGRLQRPVDCVREPWRLLW
jgi:predicted transcriptional regulator